MRQACPGLSSTCVHLLPPSLCAVKGTDTLASAVGVEGESEAWAPGVRLPGSCTAANSRSHWTPASRRPAVAFPVGQSVLSLLSPAQCTFCDLGS